MKNYAVQRAVFDFLRAQQGRDEAAGISTEHRDLTDEEAAALRDHDLRKIYQLGLHPVLLNASSRAIGLTRNDYRVRLEGLDTTRRKDPRWLRS